MDRLSKIDQMVNSYDSRLFAIRSNDGVIHVLREGAKLGDSDYLVDSYCGRPNPQFILALTDNWKLDGSPVDWGLLPIQQKLTRLDAWNKYSRPDDRIHEMQKVRDREEETKRRKQSNENRAVANELRKDFAKASNDFVIPAGQKDTTKVFMSQTKET